MKQLLAWAGSADSTITSEAVMVMAEKFNTGQEVCLQIPGARGVMQVKEGTSGPDSDEARQLRERPLFPEERTFSQCPRYVREVPIRDRALAEESVYGCVSAPTQAH